MNYLKEFHIIFNRLKKFSPLFKEKRFELFDFVFFKLKIYDSAIALENYYSNKTIVFVGQQLNYRTIKFIKWIKKNTSIKIIVVCQKTPFANDLSEKDYDKLILLRNRTHLKRIILGSKNIDFIYAFSSNPKHARIAIELSKATTIFDPYDCSIVYIGNIPVPLSQMKFIENEKKCFQLADAMVARSPENIVAYKLYQVKKKKNIYFADYCDNNLFVCKNVEIKNSDDPIRIVYSGSIAGKYINKITDGLTDFFSFIDALENQKIIFHIYPSPFVKQANYQDYIDLEKKINYLKVHTTVAQENLSEELSGFHFGALPHFKLESSTLSQHKLERATSLKFYNFLEAGIPILISEEMTYMAWVVKRYKIGIVFGKKDFPNLRNIILNTDYNELKRNVLKAREKLSMKNNLPRLIHFFNTIKN